jgi:hypothetical protein
MKNSFLKIIIALVFCLAPFVVSASSTDNLAGYAWSSNVGWISFNCTNDSSCGTSSYGVNKDTSGYLVGYAWSPNVGWIQFGGLSGFPSSPNQNAQVVGGNLVGWAKVLSADGNGWDGWISLAGTGYGVSFSGSTFSGYAWGSEVMGWISFSGVINTIMSGTLTSSAPSCTIALGASACNVNLTWNVTYPGGPTTAITATGMTDYTSPSVSGGGQIAFTVPYSGRTFNLYNNAINLTSTTVTSSCVSGTGWDVGTAKCVVLPVNGSCSSPADHLNPCLQGTPSAISDNPSTWTWTCAGSNGGTTSPTCTQGKPIPTACSYPMKHYLCGDGNETTNTASEKTSPSRWTWTCGTNPCFERKSSGIIEN